MSQTQDKSPFITFLILFIIPLAAVQLYRPLLLNVAQDLGASISSVKLTFSVFFLSFGFGQIFYGPLSEKYGQRATLFMGTAVAFIGNFVAIFAQDINQLIIARLIQGAGLASIMAVGFGCIRQSSPVESLPQKFSIIKTSNKVATVGSLALAAYLDITYGWRSSFVILAVFCIIALPFIYLRTPPPTHCKGKSSLIAHLKIYASLCKNKPFLYATIMISIGFGALRALDVVTPFLIMDEMKRPPGHFCLFAIYMTVGSLLGAYCGALLVKRMKVIYVLSYAFLLLIFTSFYGSVEDFSLHASTYVIVVAVLINFGFGMVVLLGKSLAMGAVKKHPIYASSLIGVILSLSASILSGITALIPGGSAAPIFLYILVLTLLSFIISFAFRLKEN